MRTVPGGGRARLYDLAAALPLIVFLAFVIAGAVLNVRREFWNYSFSSQFAVSVVTKIASAILAATQIALFFVRKLPIAKWGAWWPRVIAVVGGNSTLLFLMLPPAASREHVSLIPSIILIVGTLGSIFAIVRLGRSFSVTPQARGLVVSGPYRFIRHPIFLAEQVISLGIMFQYRQPWAFLVFAAGVAAQFPRMHFEEVILSRTFPGYIGYARRTARLVPGFY